MRRYEATPRVARIRDIALGTTQAIRTAIRLNIWVAIRDLYARPYMARNHPISARELYGALRMINDNIAQIQYGIDGRNIYLRSPIDITELTNGQYTR